jgi:hypothetical protein
VSVCCTRRALARFVVVALLLAGGAAEAAPRVDVLSVDLNPLIDRAAKSPTRFAVDVPYTTSPTTAGEWSTSGPLSTWTYSTQIPSAVSMSFHATRALLPESATLTVTANGVNYVYTAKDTRDGELWSRIGRGDSLVFELKVPTKDAPRVRLEITSMQAGFRAFGPGMRNHRHYDAIRTQSLGTMAASLPGCAENWSCNVTPTNEGPGDATVALIIGNVGQCSGVLLNNARQDGTPYVLTARHCENGSSDGGQPGNAANVDVYWDVVTPCGAIPGSIYDPGQHIQYRATTVVEQQDAWLIRLSASPIVDAYYAGWDATGAAIVGGFTPHHAFGGARQFVGWYGQSTYITRPVGSFENVHYESTLWGTVNEKGAVGGGASGAGLFDGSGRLIGTFVRSVESSDGVGVCPNSPVQTPSEATATGFSTALSGIFNSTADPVSTTGSVTLQSVLDPDHTGVQVLDGQKRIAVALYFNGAPVSTGVPTSLQWNSPSAQTCTASGGVSGDGWAGPLPASSGTKDVISYDDGDVTYTVTCTDGQRSGSASRTLHWTFAGASVSLGSNASIEYGVPLTLTWFASVTPCAATGGRPGDGWSGVLDPRSSKSVIETTVGSVTYTITCGSGTRTATATYTATVMAPSVIVTSDATTLRTDQPAYIYIAHSGGPCLKTGGGAGDGWAGNLPVGNNNNSLTATINESTAGTYTYTLSCGSGANIATAQATVVFTNAAPAASIHASAATAAIDAANVTLTWDSNVRPCLVGYDGPEGSNTVPTTGAPHGSATVQSSVIGPYVYWVKCGSGANSTQASATVNWTGTPTVRLNAPPDAVSGTSFNVGYASNVAPCTTSGGIAGDGWAGQSFASAFHGVNVVEPDVSKPTFTVTCGSGVQVATASVTVDIVADAPTVTLASNKAFQLTGQPITLTWTANYGPCQLTGGRSGDGWSGTVGTTGSMTVAEPAGYYVYDIACGTATAYKGVEFSDHPPPTLTASKTAAAMGDPVTLTWSSLDGAACTAGGGTPDDGWAGSRASSGSVDIKETVGGYTQFLLSCGPSYTVYVAVTFYYAPTATLSASAATASVGDSVTLTYSATHAFSCSAGGGSQTDGWVGGIFPSSGTSTIKETSSGTYVYSFNCKGDQDSTASASATVVFNAAAQPSPPPPTGGGTGSSGGGGGGGGALGPIDIGCYIAVGLIAWRRRRGTS